MSATGSVGELAVPAAFVGRERFAGYVAHELRTPLATQRALLELALADPDADVGCWREIGEDVLDCCLQQERLLEACLMLARSERRPERCEPVNLGVVAAEALRAHDLTGLDLLVTLEPAWVSGDPGLLERLVANLVSNAIGHNVVGGWIEVGSRTESGRAHISVANSGPRVPAAELQRLFKPFERLSSTSTGTRDGVGLGLVIVQAVADVHCAVVTPQTRAGGGLEIDVGFPANQDD